MIRLRYSVLLGYDILDPQADFIFNIHAALTPQQTLLSESLSINQPVPTTLHLDPLLRHRLLRLRAFTGLLSIRYQAEVELRHQVGHPDGLAEMAIADLPAEVLPYLYPSRYCESDKLQQLASQTFGHWAPGYRRVQGISDWVHERTRYIPGSSNFNTSAIDTYQQQAGVCRDFAHLMIALCRALNIPARFSSGLDYGADPTLGPTDFHAYVEVFLGGSWYIFDPTGRAMPMGLVRIGTGRDAADIAFATIFGHVEAHLPVLGIDAHADTHQGYWLPWHCAEALSTDAPQG